MDRDSKQKRPNDEQPKDVSDDSTLSGEYDSAGDGNLNITSNIVS